MAVNETAIRHSTWLIVPLDLLVIAALTWRNSTAVEGFLDEPDLEIFTGFTLENLVSFVVSCLLFSILTYAFFFLQQEEYELTNHRKTEETTSIDWDKVVGWIIVAIIILGEPIIVLSPSLAPMFSNAVLLGTSGVDFFDVAPEVVITLVITMAHILAARLTAKKYCLHIADKEAELASLE